MANNFHVLTLIISDETKREPLKLFPITRKVETMKKRNVMSAMLIGGALLTSGMLFGADVQPPEPPQAGPAMRRGAGMMQRDPLMMTARLVMDELKAYKADPTAENLTKLETALKAAMVKDTAQRKEMLEKRQAEIKETLANLDKTQEQRITDFMAKVKSGDLKLPERPGKGAGRGERRGPGAPPAPEAEPQD